LIDREPRDFDEEDVALLRDLTRMAEQELAAVQLATMDELTMLSNRRGFEALAAHALHVSRRLGKPAALLYFDLDQFKQINDQYGHAEGDRALMAFARLLQHTFRESDVLGRLGGDEFAALLTNVETTGLGNSLDRLRDALAQHNEEANRGYDITFSAGEVFYDAARHQDISALMAEADALMYRNKKKKTAADSSASHGDIPAVTHG
jgi:diguanylate cyclase (GGDEF)-like protein